MDCFREPCDLDVLSFILGCAEQLEVVVQVENHGDNKRRPDKDLTRRLLRLESKGLKHPAQVIVCTTSLYRTHINLYSCRSSSARAEVDAEIMTVRVRTAC